MVVDNYQLIMHTGDMRTYPSGTSLATVTGTPATYSYSGAVKPARTGFDKCIAYDFDGVLHEKPGWSMTWGKIDLTLIDMAHQRKIAVAIQTCNDTWRIAEQLVKRGYLVQDDNVTPAGPVKGSPNWHGGNGGRVVLITNRKVCAKWYVDDRAIHYTYDQQPAEVFREVERRLGYAMCAEGQAHHWGPDGAAGILPWTVFGGRVWVLLSKRGQAVQHGGTWSTFGGAIDPEDVTTWEAAWRETAEETKGMEAHLTEIASDDAGYVAYCPHGCGWFYQTFAVELQSGEKLPKVEVNHANGAGFETSMVRWFPLQVAVTMGDLHPGLQDSIAELSHMIAEQLKRAAEGS